MPRVTFTETSPSGAVKTYVLTDNNASSSDDEGVAAQGRIDLIPPTAAKSTTLGTDATWLQYLLAAFLPVGYPDSVSPDYTSYQREYSIASLALQQASLSRKDLTHHSRPQQAQPPSIAPTHLSPLPQPPTLRQQNTNPPQQQSTTPSKPSSPPPPPSWPRAPSSPLSASAPRPPPPP